MRNVTILIVSVNDMMVSGDDLQEVSSLKSHLTRESETKDSGSLRYFLGIEVAKSHNVYLSPNENMFLISYRRLVY